MKKLNLGCFWNYHKNENGNNSIIFKQLVKPENSNFLMNSDLKENFFDYPITSLIIKNDLLCSLGSIEFSIRTNGNKTKI